MNNNDVRMERNTASDEIDLRELVLQLWDARYTIIAITALVFLAAALYAFLSTPVYQVQARALPPAAAGLEAYNRGYRLTDINTVFPVIRSTGQTGAVQLTADSMSVLTPAQAHGYFSRHLSSTALRRAFFEQHYAPSIGLNVSQGGSELAQAWRSFSGQISVQAQGRSGDVAVVTWQGTDPFAIAEWTNAYMQMAVEAAQEELSADLDVALQTLNKSLDDQVASLRAGARREREQRIVRLGEALQLAESIGLHKPSDVGNLITTYTGETAYMRGADALRNEIHLLKTRSNDDPYIPELTGLFMQRAMLETVEINPREIAVAQIDEIAAPPASPIKPRKRLIMALGLVLGGMLGIFVVLVRNMFRND